MKFCFPPDQDQNRYYQITGQHNGSAGRHSGDSSMDGVVRVSHKYGVLERVSCVGASLVCS